MDDQQAAFLPQRFATSRNQLRGKFGDVMHAKRDEALGLGGDGRQLRYGCAHPASTKGNRGSVPGAGNTIAIRAYHDRHHSVKKTAVVADAAGPSIGPSVAEILEWHAGGSGSPTKTAARVADAIASRGDDGTWLSVVPRDQLLAAAEEIEKRPGARTLPLYGVPFGVKDSIDVEGVPTTLSCPDYAYVASTDRTGGAPASRRGRALRRQDQPRPVRHRAERHPHPVHRAAQCLRRRNDLRRIEFRLGAGRRAGPGAVRRRDRHRGLGSGARRAQRRRRLQTVARPDQHRRPGPGLQIAGLHQRHGRLHRRCRPRLRGDGRP